MPRQICHISEFDSGPKAESAYPTQYIHVVGKAATASKELGIDRLMIDYLHLL